MSHSLELGPEMGAAVPSGDLGFSVEATNRRPGVSGRTSGSHIFNERGADGMENSLELQPAVSSLAAASTEFGQSLWK
jgi:hypothetical protein